jgi:transmembrane sensor
MKVFRNNFPPEDADEAASCWAARQRLGTISPRESHAFAAWLEDPVHAAAWQRTDDILSEVVDYGSFSEMRTMREAALQARPMSQPKAKRNWGVVSALAATLLIAFVGVSLLLMPRIFTEGPKSASATIASEGLSSVKRYATRIGEQRTVLLADGSGVTINTASIVEVAYSERQRNIRLVQGQALFKVAKDTSRPFVVTAGNRTVTATGTVFDVRLEQSGKVSVLLVEGKVRVQKVTPANAIEPSLVIAPIQMLDAGERLTFASAVETQPIVAAVDIERATSWTRGQLVFRDDKLSDAITEINRYSENRLVITDPRVANLRVSGVFTPGANENFVAALSALQPVAARPMGDDVTELVWRP